MNACDLPVTRHVMFLVITILGLSFHVQEAKAKQQNSHIAKAEQALLDLDFDNARNEIKRALRSGENTPKQLERIYSLFAIIEASFGKVKLAVVFFRRALAINPSFQLPEGLSPKITKPFNTAKVETNSRSLQLTTCSPSAKNSVHISISDTNSLVKRIEAIIVDEDGNKCRRIARHKKDITFGFKKQTVRDVSIRFLDKYGNTVIDACKLNIDPVEDKLEKSFQPDSNARPSPSWIGNWKTWGIASVGLSLAGAYWSERRNETKQELNRHIAKSEMYDFTSAKEIEKRGVFETQMTNAFLGMAAASVLVTGYLWFSQPPDKKPEGSTVSARLVSKGAIVVYSSSF